MHPYSELNLHSIPLIHDVHSSVTRAPLFNIVNTPGSRIDKRQHEIRWSELHRKHASPPHTHFNKTGELWRKDTGQHAEKHR